MIVLEAVVGEVVGTVVVVVDVVVVSAKALEAISAPGTAAIVRAARKRRISRTYRT
jgi:hypothetical protein